MFIAPYLLLAATATTGMHSPDLPSVSRFVEDLIASEVTLQLDRREVSVKKANAASVRALMNDAAVTRTLVQSFEDEVLSKLSEPLPQTVIDLRESLAAYKLSLDGPNLIPKKIEERAPCCEHNASYIKLVGAAFRYPGFSPTMISLPTQYNMSPVLYEPNFGPIYADAAHPEEARILPRSARRGSKLRTGDVIVGFRKDDEDAWKPVKTWQDVIKGSDDFGRENEIKLQIRRGKAVKNIVVSSTVVAVEGG